MLCSLIEFSTRFQSEVNEVLGNKTYVDEKELEELQYTEQVNLNSSWVLAIIIIKNTWE